MVKGAKSKRGIISLEKNTGKKKKTAKKKGIDCTNSSIGTIVLFYACIINFMCLTIGEESNNVVENSYEGAGLEKFIVRLLTLTAFIFILLAYMLFL